MLTDYTDVTASDIAAITTDAIAAADALVDAAATADPPTYADVLGRLDRALDLTSRAYGRGAFMARVHSEPEVRDAAVAAEERLTKWSTDLAFRRDLYESVARFAATPEADALDPLPHRLLEFVQRDFRRAGHELDEASRTRLQELRRRLVELEVAFNRNLDEWDDGIEMTREELDGLSDDYVGRLRRVGDDRYRVSMEYPDYIPFMQQATNRELRRRLQFKFWNRAAEQNVPLLQEAVAIRRDVAELLGYATWADFAMEIKMAGDPAAVDEFYDSLVPGLEARAREELAVLAELAADEFDDAVLSWDTTYLDNLQRKRDHGIDQEEVAGYFPLDQVVAGMFEITGEVFGLDYVAVEDPRAWHPDVLVYQIRNRGETEPLAYFYADLYPREGKFGHAAAFPLVHGQRLPDGSYEKPVAAIVANFTKPTATAPSLLKHDEALTLFHEFGHILHFCLTTVDLVRFAGFDTEWDFVEAPSQIMENWMWEPEVLQRFARHHETGEPIPEDLVRRLVAARDLNEGLFTMRQVFLGKLDLGMHAVDEVPDLMDVYRHAYGYTLLPFHEGTAFHAGFGHLMGGYDAGYYGYLWARVFGDDMFSEFERGGILSEEVGGRYRTEVLAAGASRDAIDHLRAFLGREPNSEAFLRKLGLSA